MKGIYKITNKTNNKVYIGESLNIERRWEEHIEDLNNNKHHSYKLQNDWNTYGQDNFKFEIVKEINTSTAVIHYILIVLEHKYMKEFNSITNGYNVENTLKEMLDGKKAILGNKINKMNINILKNVINNMNKNNGVYISQKEQLYTGEEFLQIAKNIEFKDEWQTFKRTFNGNKDMKISIDKLFTLFRENGIMNKKSEFIINTKKDNNIIKNIKKNGTYYICIHKGEGFSYVCKVIAKMIDKYDFKCYRR